MYIQQQNTINDVHQKEPSENEIETEKIPKITIWVGVWVNETARFPYVCI